MDSPVAKRRHRPGTLRRLLRYPLSPEPVAVPDWIIGLEPERTGTERVSTPLYLGDHAMHAPDTGVTDDPGGDPPADQ